jgi:hypothetical protein
LFATDAGKITTLPVAAELLPAALGGAVACLFVREIIDLKHFSVRA